MNKNIENLKKIKVSGLTPTEIDSRINLLLASSFNDVIAYLLYVIDIEYTISTNTKEEDETIELFLSDKKLNKFRDGIAKHLN